MQTVTSRQNPLCKHVRRLRENRSYRYACREFLADGTKLVREAIRWGVPLRCVILSPGVTLDGLPPETELVSVPDALMRELSRMETPQGVLAVCGMPEPAAYMPQPGSLILDGIQDPGNLGTILRTADALQTPVALCEGCADPYGEKTVRASMGAVLRTPPIQTTRAAVLEACRTHGIPLYATALRADARDLRETDLSAAATVIGSEGQGVSEEFLSAAQQTVVIPMSPRCESLNAAVAAAIVMWQVRWARPCGPA